MASALVTKDDAQVDAHERVIDFYREALAKKPDLPDYAYPPVVIGPTWQLDDSGYWLLPERTLGWDVIGWCGTWLQHGRDEPWRFTMEQARFILWWYALQENGDFLYRDGVLQRLKGWGKDPIGATICATELVGPCRFEEWWHGSEPVATDRPAAWVQTAAVSLEQTKNTMRLFPGLFTPQAKERFGLQIGKEQIYALNGGRFMQAHTSSPSTMEGNRVTFVLMNETHLWTESNEGHEMFAVVRRNAAKAPDGGSRSLSITNAYTPGQDTVAEKRRETYEKMRAGTVLTEGLLYDSLEASVDAPLTPEAAPLVVPSIRGDSLWLRPQNIVAEILDNDNPPSQSRRWWYNQIWASEESWTTPAAWDRCEDKKRELKEGDQIVLFFDGSKSEDATALAGCRLSDGHVVTFGVWERPQLAVEWNVPRQDVDDIVSRVFAMYDVRGFYCDPGSGKDDEGARYWYPLIDKWNRDYGSNLDVKATDYGANRHAVMWDMRGGQHYQQFTEACEFTVTDIADKALTHDGNYIMRSHVANARRRPNAHGVAIGKESPSSSRKIDLCVCMIGARMLRRIWQALPSNKKRRKKTGRVMYA